MTTDEKDDLTPAELARLEDEGGITLDEEPTERTPLTAAPSAPCKSEGVNSLLGTLNPMFN